MLSLGFFSVGVSLFWSYMSHLSTTSIATLSSPLPSIPQIVSHTRHPLDVNINDAAFNPPNARMVLAALLAAGPRLHKLSLRGSWLGRTVLKSLLQSGLCATQLDLSNCKNLRGKLAFQGDFTRLRTLVLDANPGIQNLTQVGCLLDPSGNETPGCILSAVHSQLLV
jgi:hypothetical protein